MSTTCREELRSIKDSIECCLLQNVRKGDVDIDALGTWCNAVVKRINAALAKPDRNCDVGTVKEQTERFNDFCESNMQHYKDMFGDGLDGWDCKDDCPIGKMIDCEKAVADRCQLAWAQLPYTNEGAK